MSTVNAAEGNSMIMTPRQQQQYNRIASQQTRMTAEERARVEQQAQIINSRINPNSNEEPGRLGKESFLRLLVTELQHQDPTRPMEDRDFIAQMAQFSSLEQARNLNSEIQNLIRSSRSAEAFSLLGKRIEAYNERTRTRTSGIVDSVRFHEDQMFLRVGRTEVPITDVQQVHNVTETRTSNPVQAYRNNQSSGSNQTAQQQQ
jgi:flagellar basal-body rod modification protein FlgD